MHEKNRQQLIHFKIHTYFPLIFGFSIHPTKVLHISTIYQYRLFLRKYSILKVIIELHTSWQRLVRKNDFNCCNNLKSNLRDPKK